jgi:hypothetical protein
MRHDAVQSHNGAKEDTASSVDGDSKMGESDELPSLGHT